MKVFNSTDEVIEAIVTCEDKKEVNLAMKALLALATHDKAINKDDFSPDGLAGSVLISTMMLAVKNL